MNSVHKRRLKTTKHIRLHKIEIASQRRQFYECVYGCFGGRIGDGVGYKVDNKNMLLILNSQIVTR